MFDHPGHTCSKLAMSFVSETLRLEMYCTQKCCHSFAEKKKKNIKKLDFIGAISLIETLSDDFIMLMMLITFVLRIFIIPFFKSMWHIISLENKLALLHLFHTACIYGLVETSATTYNGQIQKETVLE